MIFKVIIFSNWIIFFNNLLSYSAIIIRKNIVLISKAQSDIEYTYNRVDEVESAVQNISTDYDNSDVISNIRQAHNSIVRHIDDAEDNLRRNIIIWGN